MREKRKIERKIYVWVCVCVKKKQKKKKYYRCMTVEKERTANKRKMSKLIYI